MEATVYMKNLHISPKKLRMMVDDIRSLTPGESLSYLHYSPKKGAAILYKAVKSAIDNAKYTLKAGEDLLQFKLLIVEQGNALKRFRPGGRGTAKPYKKRYSHLKIVLLSKQVKKQAAKKVAEPAPVAAEKQAAAKKEDQKVKKVTPPSRRVETKK